MTFEIRIAARRYDSLEMPENRSKGTYILLGVFALAPKGRQKGDEIWIRQPQLLLLQQKRN